MFGRKPKLPVDMLFQQANDQTEEKTVNEYSEDLKKRIEKTKEIVEQHTEKARQKQKKFFDRKAKAVKVSVGDKVLVKILKFDGKHKIADKFEEELYEVIEQQRGNIPVYKVKAERSGKVKTLHRNHLYLVNDKDNTNEVNERVQSRTETQVRGNEQVPEKRLTSDKVDQPNGKEIKKREEKVSDVTDEESDEETGLTYVLPTYRHEDAHDPDTSSETQRIESEKDECVPEVLTTESIETDTVGIDVLSDHHTTIVKKIDEEKEKGPNTPKDQTGCTNAFVDNTEKRDTDIVIQNIDNEVTVGSSDNVGAIGDNISESEKSKKHKGVIELDKDSTTDTRNVLIGQKDKDEKAKQIINVSPPKAAPRRSKRDKKEPEWHKDYHMKQMIYYV
ncbi:uncharacterized protein LOC128556665 [Mercenaria mercenaria]|uniref:uncharacterized protein LOC128556665 n=1 Tax=Mercenaria mercenaria TaxID=6596 RepID=UPI00234E873C|nr:uncharacterized protein LOC128556665 [Mercenaria mercenaria]